MKTFFKKALLIFLFVAPTALAVGVGLHYGNKFSKLAAEAEDAATDYSTRLSVCDEALGVEESQAEISYGVWQACRRDLVHERNICGTELHEGTPASQPNMMVAGSVDSSGVGRRISSDEYGAVCCHPYSACESGCCLEPKDDDDRTLKVLHREGLPWEK